MTVRVQAGVWRYDYGLGHRKRHIYRFVQSGFVSIGWDKIGDLQKIGPSRDKRKELLAASFPETKPGAIPDWACILFRFGFELEPGDVVVAPFKSDSTIIIGVISGDYTNLADESPSGRLAPIRLRSKRATS